MPERGAKPNVPKVRQTLLKAVSALSSPLLPDDYLELINPLWSTRELRGRVDEIRHETADAATVVIRPGYRWSGHEPGQYLRIGVDIEGVRHWRAYSLTSEPERDDGRISIHVRPGRDARRLRGSLRRERTARAPLHGALPAEARRRGRARRGRHDRVPAERLHGRIRRHEADPRRG